MPLQTAGNFKFLKDNEALLGQVASAGSSRLRSHMHKGLSDPIVSVPSPLVQGRYLRKLLVDLLIE